MMKLDPMQLLCNVTELPGFARTTRVLGLHVKTLGSAVATRDHETTVGSAPALAGAAIVIGTTRETARAARLAVMRRMLMRPA
jgi:hypothetical protein